MSRAKVDGFALFRAQHVSATRAVKQDQHLAQTDPIDPAWELAHCRGDKTHPKMLSPGEHLREHAVSMSGEIVDSAGQREAQRTRIGDNERDAHSRCEVAALHSAVQWAVCLVIVRDGYATVSTVLGLVWPQTIDAAALVEPVRALEQEGSILRFYLPDRRVAWGLAQPPV